MATSCYFWGTSKSCFVKSEGKKWSIDACPQFCCVFYLLFTTFYLFFLFFVLSFSVSFLLLFSYYFWGTSKSWFVKSEGKNGLLMHAPNSAVFFIFFFTTVFAVGLSSPSFHYLLPLGPSSVPFRCLPFHLCLLPLFIMGWFHGISLFYP